MNNIEWLTLFYKTTNCTFDLTNRKSKKSFQGWNKQGKPLE